MINFSKYKDLFMPSRRTVNNATMLSLRNDNDKLLSTEQLDLKRQTYKAI